MLGEAAFGTARMHLSASRPSGRALFPGRCAPRDVEALNMASLKEWVSHRKCKGLLERLTSPDPAARNAAIDSLAAQGSSACADIIAGLSCTNPQVRSGAATALGRIRSPKAVDPLCERLADPDDSVRLAVAHALRELGDHALPALIRCLQSSRADIRRSTASALGLIGDTRATTHLVACLTDDDINVAHAAAEALGSIRDPRAVQPLVHLLHSKVSSIAHRIGTPEALSALRAWKEHAAVAPPAA
jgi:HEAT repeat protein